MWPRNRNWFLFEAPEVGAGSAPGTGEAAPTEPQGTPAEAVITDSPDGTPGPVPYSRFKEVNDSRRELAERVAVLDELAASGYTADDFRRLATWEQEYIADPTGVWVDHALANIADLPPEVKAVLEQYQAAKGAGHAETAPAEGGPGTATASDEPPEWARELIEDRQARLAEQARQASSSALDSLIDAWKSLDAEQGIKTPEKAMLTFISSHADAGDLTAVLRGAREEFLATREELLQDVVTPMRNGGTAPTPVPGGGSGSALAAEPVRPRTLAEATRLAEEADSRGALVLTDD